MKFQELASFKEVTGFELPRNTCYCPYCGAIRDAGALYCKKCGKRLS